MNIFLKRGGGSEWITRAFSMDQLVHLYSSYPLEMVRSHMFRPASRFLPLCQWIWYSVSVAGFSWSVSSACGYERNYLRRLCIPNDEREDVKAVTTENLVVSNKNSAEGIVHQHFTCLRTFSFLMKKKIGHCSHIDNGKCFKSTFRTKSYLLGFSLTG